ncbi:uncharacterized protein LOC116604025 [Nematostella vectensis]|uniref:uncharacterized protein LOC116604025 n=1 Tax=Nematostella vectensis TaxID=45351 RepID=UPI0020771931|nr:uncharacterized protein LOC116604025 [Nematostella vectensis]
MNLKINESGKNMIKIIIGSLLFAGFISSEAKDPCAIPLQLQGHMITVTHVIGDKVKPLTESSVFNYDGVGQRIHSKITFDTGESHTHIKMYKTKQWFIISSDGSCKVTKLTGRFPLLQIPKGSIESGNTSSVIVYSGSDNKGQYLITVTEKTCLPLTWTAFVSLESDRYMVNQRYFSDVKDWIDLMKFVPPTSCTRRPRLGRIGLPW